MLDKQPSPKKPQTSHEIRLDLQGIRGWAVIAVVVFHFFPSALPFGYLGVDVFFVLSGFLIALVLDYPNPFSISTYITFYFRRFRRIFPLLLLAVVIVLVYAEIYHNGYLFYYSTLSALYALAFSTNLKARDMGEEYFMKLTKADDFFTHTWSLAVEIQFYCIAPFVFCIGKKVFGERGWPLVPYLLLLADLSLYYHALSDASTAFNSVFARLWQFLLGSAAFQIQKSWCSYLPVSETEAALERDDAVKKLNSAALIVSILPVLCYVQDKVLFARVFTTAFTVLLIYSRSKSSLLTGWPIVRMGDASYSLYLIHWPAVCMLKEWKIESFLHKAATVFLCCILSVLSQHFYEKWYLSLKVRGTLILSGVLYGIALATIAFTKGTIVSTSLEKLFDTEPNSAELGIDYTLFYGYDMERTVYGAWNDEWKRNLTTQEWMEINDHDETFWGKNLKLKCNQTHPEPYKGNPYGMCEGPKGNGSLRFLSLGNSYNANFGRLVQKHLKSYYSDLDFYTVAECQAIYAEGIVETCYDSSHFFNAARYHTHDVLFVIQLWHFPNQPIVNISTDKRVREILKDVEAYGATAKKVFFLSALPHPKDTRSIMEQYMKANKSIDPIKDMPFVDVNATYDRIRLEEVARLCSNCVLFDVYDRHLDSEGNFIMVHPHTHIQFFERVKHYTPYGLRLIEPVFEKMAKEFPRLMEAKYPENIFKLQESGVIKPSI